MKFVVYDVAAQDGGGLLVLNNFYKEVVKKSPKNIEWYFIVSQDGFESKENINILKYDKPKKTWFHRLQFENKDLIKILDDIKPDLLISLQNMPVKNWDGTQYTYLHQSLQYCPKKFSFLKKEERNTAIRQRIICNIIKRLLPKSKHIFVQTNWMKDATSNWINYNRKNIDVVPVKVEKTFDFKYIGLNSKTFFYPARAEMYKNHQVIIDACKILNNKVRDYKVIFTIDSNENDYASNLYNQCKDLPIDFISNVDYKEVWRLYSKTILLYPSYLETCGLPLLEAKEAGSYILSSNMPYSNEALSNYPNKMYFEYNNPNDLANKMEEVINGVDYVEYNTTELDNISLLEKIIRIYIDEKSTLAN